MRTAFKVQTLEGETITIKGLYQSDSNEPSIIEITLNDNNVIYRRTSDWSKEVIERIINTCYQKCFELKKEQLTRSIIVKTLSYNIEQF